LCAQFVDDHGDVALLKQPDTGDSCGASFNAQLRVFESNPAESQHRYGRLRCFSAMADLPKLIQTCVVGSASFFESRSEDGEVCAMRFSTGYVS
jgi:hypothetical protein